MKFKVQSQEVMLCGIKEQDRQRASFQRMEAIKRDKLKVVDSSFITNIKYEEYEEKDKEDFATIDDVSNYLGTSNLSKFNYQIYNGLYFN